VGCGACYKCFTNKDHRCARRTDFINTCIEKMEAADGIILASPTYFADITSEMKALIDRSGMVARANEQMFARKVGAAVVAVRRAGAIHAFDSINHFFYISGMIVPGWDTAQTFEDPEFERSPFELGLAWNVELDRDGDFVGKQALLKERTDGSRFVLKGFEIDAECELLDGAELFAEVDGADLQVGTLPSVSWSHDPARWIGLSSLRTGHSDVKDCYVVVDDERQPCRIVELPFVQIARRRQVPAPL